MKEPFSSPETRIINLKKALELRKFLRERKKKIVVTNGCFDIIHRGHAEYLYRARSLGDFLLVLLNSDKSVRALKGPSRPLVKEKDRAYLIASLSCVDAVIIFRTRQCADLLLKLKPDIYVKGGDYNINNIDRDEKNALSKSGAKIRFIKFISDFSTSKILEKIR